MNLQRWLHGGRILSGMTTPSTGKASTAKKRSAKPPSEGVEDSSLPSLRFHYPKSLHKRTLALLDTVEASSDPTDHRDELAEIVEELMISGMNDYFMKPLKEAKAGFIIQQSANLGMAGAQKVLGSVLESIIGRMDGPQLLSICSSIRQFMR